MKTWFIIACGIVLACLAAPSAKADFSFQFGTDNFFLSVGDYDYLPYIHRDDPRSYAPRINFYDMMGEYGRWIRVRPFGRVWRPYASYGWRPYMYGHWLYTEYGLCWEGYEPWAWVGYHYGSWIFSSRYGWLWVPGYEWHPGRVWWAYGYDTLGWMPRPPDGYDYYRGDLRYIGENYPSYYDGGDSWEDYGPDAYDYRGPYDDPRDRDRYRNSNNISININLWIFIDSMNFTDDNYADYDLGPDFARYAFGEGMVKITDRPMEQRTLEMILQQPVRRVPMDVREFRSDRGMIQVVVPSGSASMERMRRQSPSVVRQVIAPAFAEEKQQFKGRNSKIQSSVDKFFRQENIQPRVESRSREQVIDQARKIQQTREQSRIVKGDTVKQRTERLKQEGRMSEPRQEPGRSPAKPVEQPPATGGDWSRPNTPQRPVIPERLPVPQQGLQNEEISKQIRIKLMTQLPKIARGIGIDTEDGVVLVSGSVANAAERDRIIQFVSSVSGVKSVKSRLTIKHILSR